MFNSDLVRLHLWQRISKHNNTDAHTTYVNKHINSLNSAQRSIVTNILSHIYIYIYILYLGQWMVCSILCGTYFVEVESMCIWTWMCCHNIHLLNMYVLSYLFFLLFERVVERLGLGKVWGCGRLRICISWTLCPIHTYFSTLPYPYVAYTRPLFLPRPLHPHPIPRALHIVFCNVAWGFHYVSCAWYGVTNPVLLPPLQFHPHLKHMERNQSKYPTVDFWQRLRRTWRSRFHTHRTEA